MKLKNQLLHFFLTHVVTSSEEELRMTVQPSDYMDKLVEYGIMKIFGICAVDETHQVWCEEDDFQVVKPPMKIEVCTYVN